MLAKQSVSAWSNDYASSMGAALAYYTLFSLAPLLLLVIAVAEFVYGGDAARGAIIAQFSGLIGEEGAVAIQGLLKSASQPAQSLVASVTSIVMLAPTQRLAEPVEVVADRPCGSGGRLRTRLRQ
jgi:membrane protein